MTPERTPSPSVYLHLGKVRYSDDTQKETNVGYEYPGAVPKEEEGPNKDTDFTAYLLKRKVGELVRQVVLLNAQNGATEKHLESLRMSYEAEIEIIIRDVNAQLVKALGELDSQQKKLQEERLESIVQLKKFRSDALAKEHEATRLWTEKVVLLTAELNTVRNRCRQQAEAFKNAIAKHDEQLAEMRGAHADEIAKLRSPAEDAYLSPERNIKCAANQVNGSSFYMEWTPDSARKKVDAGPPGGESGPEPAGDSHADGYAFRSPRNVRSPRSPSTKSRGTEGKLGSIIRNSNPAAESEHVVSHSPGAAGSTSDGEGTTSSKERSSPPHFGRSPLSPTSPVEMEVSRPRAQSPMQAGCIAGLDKVTVREPPGTQPGRKSLSKDIPGPRLSGGSTPTVVAPKKPNSEGAPPHATGPWSRLARQGTRQSISSKDGTGSVPVPGGSRTGPRNVSPVPPLNPPGGTPPHADTPNSSSRAGLRDSLGSSDHKGTSHPSSAQRTRRREAENSAGTRRHTSPIRSGGPGPRRVDRFSPRGRGNPDSADTAPANIGSLDHAASLTSLPRPQERRSSPAAKNHSLIQPVVSQASASGRPPGRRTTGSLDLVDTDPHPSGKLQAFQDGIRMFEPPRIVQRQATPSIDDAK